MIRCALTVELIVHYFHLSSDKGCDGDRGMAESKI
ncbi:MAG: hypothetical protein SBU_000815 [Candidatus Syntrophoarchaeum butanivorans]|uniref:Uncharacterized protein n=1 Tax=Candidatus Syntropharchaeum butanivorans TaxID=1839936 RepID=A0A1F2P522_9EURY|nr:MAG: hypothetical protein SBU_000815 [Candidatus Syntrophoarchaeum butanivorans]